MMKVRDENSVYLPDPEHMTKLGDFLCRTSIDELPSLVNTTRGEMEHLDEYRTFKGKIYRRFQEDFKNLPISMNPYLSDTVPNFWRSCMLIESDTMCKVVRAGTATEWLHESGETCPDGIAQMLAMNNIEMRPIWKPMHMQPVYRRNDFISMGVGEDVFARGLCLRLILR